jgi:uncharacterized protein YjbJ (UPF0337 family)
MACPLHLLWGVYTERTDHEFGCVEGKWHQLKGEIKSQWGRLTDDDLDVVQGDMEKLIGKVQERYGYERDRARKEVDEYFKRHPVVA